MQYDILATNISEEPPVTIFRVDSTAMRTSDLTEQSDTIEDHFRASLGAGDVQSHSKQSGEDRCEVVLIWKVIHAPPVGDAWLRRSFRRT
jgi:hypothetical protein